MLSSWMARRLCSSNRILRSVDMGLVRGSSSGIVSPRSQKMMARRHTSVYLSSRRLLKLSLRCDVEKTR